MFEMKLIAKVTTAVLILGLVFLTCAVAEQGNHDFTDWTYDELVELKEALDREIVSRPEWQEVGKFIWISPNGGTRYHTNPTCMSMRNPVRLPISFLKFITLDPCSVCKTEN